MHVGEYYGVMADLLSASSSYLLAIVAIATVYIAGLELGKWRAELLGRASHDAAKKLYNAAKRWQYAYHGARVPLRYIRDDSLEPSANETPVERSQRLSREQEFQLLESLRVATLAVEEANWDVETSSEMDISELVRHLVGDYGDLRNAVYEYYDLQDLKSRTDADVKQSSELRRKVYGLESDVLGQTVQRHVDALLTAARLLALGKTPRK